MPGRGRLHVEPTRHPAADRASLRPFLRICKTIVPNVEETPEEAPGCMMRPGLLVSSSGSSFPRRSRRRSTSHTAG